MIHASVRLIEERCTACNICARECPAWAIEIESHIAEAATGGRRSRAVAALDSFRLDYGTCLFCGICIEECPFDALRWSATPVPVGRLRTDLVQQREQLAVDPGDSP